MIVHHFLPAEFALRALRDRRLKIARLDELHDPFEFGLAGYPDVGARNELKTMRNRLNEQYGVLCFSRIYHDPVLWSRYADDHRGVALLFEIPDERAIAVSYQPEYFDPCLTEAIQRGHFDERDAGYWVSTRFASWCQEQEIRMICGLSDHFCQIDARGKKVYFESLSLESFGVDALKLIGLIRGAHCDLKSTDIASELLAVDTLLVQDTRLDRTSFQVIAGKAYPVTGERSFTTCCFRG